MHLTLTKRRFFRSFVLASLWTLFGLVGTALAASTVTVNTSGLQNGQFPGAPVKAGSLPAAVAKVSVTASQADQTLTAVTVHFSGSGFVESDLATLATGNTSGAILYDDTGTIPGQYDGLDAPITASGAIAWGATSGTVTIAPATPVALTNGVAKIFYVAFRTSGTVSNEDRIMATVGINGVATSDGSGPTASVTTNDYRVDTIAPTIFNTEAYVSSTQVKVVFSEPVQSYSGGNITSATTPLTFSDGGGTSQSISSISHTLGQSVVTVTLNGDLEPADLDGSPATIAAGVNKITDMAGNVVGNSAANLSSQLKINTAAIPAATGGSSYTSGSPLQTLVAVGTGAATVTWTTADVTSTQTFSTIGLTINSTSGKITGTALNAPGSYSISFQAANGTATATRGYTINIAPSGGAGIPGISSVNPAGGVQNTTVVLSIIGANTHWASTSTVEFLLPSGVSGVSGITTSGAVATNGTTLSLNAIISSNASTGTRDIKITSASQSFGSETVTLPNAFTVLSAGGSGLTLLLPSADSANVQTPPGFSFSQSADTSVQSYRLSVKTASDPSNSITPIWDYAFSKTSSLCSVSQCNVAYGDGQFNILTQATTLSANTDYYWQVKSFATTTQAVTSSTTPLESTSVQKFTTVNSITDVSPPNIFHQPVFKAVASTLLKMHARVLDNLSNASSTPALTAKIFYCSGASCTPTTEASGAALGAGYFSFSIPALTIGAADTIVRYYLQANDGTNSVNFKQPDSTPFQLTSVASGALTISGSIKDGSNLCPTAIQGALVLAAGTGINTNTDSNCDFTLTGVFTGSYTIVASKSGYSELSVNGIPAATTNLNLRLTQGGGGGFGGSTTKPKVKFSSPADGAANMPGNDSNLKVFLVFDKSMNQGAITTQGNLTVNNVNPGSGTSTDITSRGSWTFYPTAPTAPGIPSEANMAVWSLSGTNTIGDDKTIQVVANSAITDTSGNTIQGNQSDGSYGFSFTTGKAFTGSFSGDQQFGGGAFVPPHVQGSTPTPGSTNVPKNTPVIINFSEAMASDAGSYLIKDYVKIFRVTGTTETDISSSAIDTVNLDSTKKTAKIALKSAFNSGIFESTTKYRLKVLGGAKASSNLTIAPSGSGSQVMYVGDFTTGSTSDTAAPTVVGSYPDTNATGTPVGLAAASVGFSKDMDASTITADSVYLSVGSTVVNGTVEYRPLERQAVFLPKSALDSNTTYTLNVTTAVAALNGTTLATAVARNFTTGGSDAVQPSLSFMNADEYNVALTYSEPMNSAKVTDTLNWGSSVVNPSVYATIKYGNANFDPSSTGTAVSLTGATLGYDAMSNTVMIKGLAIPSAAIGKQLYIAVNTIGVNQPKDLSGNTILSTGASVRVEIKNSTATKGQLGPMAMTTDSFSSGGGFTPQNFSVSEFGFAPPVEVKPFNTMAGQTTIYGVRLPISKQVPSGGTLVLTFPTGFDVTGAKQDINSPMRTDLNGQMTGTITFKCQTNTVGGKSCAGGAANADDTGTGLGGLADDGVVVNPTARTVTIYLSAASATSGKDFLTVDIAGIKNSSVPKDFNTSGYTVDVKTMDGSTMLESLTSMPIFIQSSGSITLSGTITATGNDQAGTMKVYLMSPMTGPIEATSGSFGGNTTTSYSFANLPTGTYGLFTDQIITVGSGGTAKEFVGKAMPEMLALTTSTTFNFTLQGSTATGTAVTINIVGPANEPLDVFAGSPTGFRVKQATLNSDASDTDVISLNLPDGQWFLGVGPQMPKGFGGGPPQATTYLPPKPKNVNISGSTCNVEGAVGCTITFTLTSASKTIKGVVKDATDKIMANAEVFAYSPQGGYGTHGQTDTAGAFSLAVTDGTYIVGSFVPGMPPSKEVPVVVSSSSSAYLLIDGSATAITPAAAATSFVLRVAKPDYTISGKVTDGTNVVQGASVYAYRTDGPGHANANTGSAGTYTLYVTNGTWKVGSFLPQYGNLSEQTVTVSGASASNINFSPSQTGTFYAVSGRVYTDTNGNLAYDSGEESKGSFVRITGNGTFNEAITGTDGTYSFNVPEGNNYVLKAFVPGVGELTPTAAFNVAAAVPDKDFRVTTPNTISVIFSAVATDVYIDAFATSGQGAHVFLKSGTSTSLSLPNGTYKMNISMPGASLGATDIAATNASTTYSGSTALLTVDGNEGVTVTVPTLRTISGTVTDGSAALSDAWVEVTQPSTAIHFGTKTDTSGIFSLKVVDSSTAYTINAMKPGYFRQGTSLTVNGSNPDSQTLAMNAATVTISGQITINNATATTPFVRAEKQGGGSAGTQADANGNYTMYVTAGTWHVYAVAEGYAEAELSSGALTVGATNLTGKNINLTTTVSLNPLKTKPITPASGGTLEDTAAGIKLSMPANALGTGTSAGSVQSKETNNVRETSTSYPLGGKAVEFKATNSSNNPITNFNSEITVDLSYTKVQLAASKSTSDSSINTKAEVDALKMGYWDETTANWVTIPSTITYKDSSGSNITSPASDLSDVSSITISANTTHFSEYAPIVSTGSSPPDMPTGLVATAVDNSRVNLSWNVVSGATGYDIYRGTVSGGTSTRLGTEPTISSQSTHTYSDTGLTASTAYYYKISAVSASGESTSTAAVSATTGAAAGAAANTGGGGTSAGSGGGSSGGSSAGQSPSAPTSPVVASPAVVAPTTPIPAGPVVVAPNVSTPESQSPEKELIGPPEPVIDVIEKAGVTFTGVPFKGDTLPGKKISYGYGYKNVGKARQQVDVTRTMSDASGKVIVTSKASTSVSPGASFSRKVTDVLGAKFRPGVYKVTVTITDKKTKKQIAKGAFNFKVVSKPSPKVEAKPLVVKFTVAAPSTPLAIGDRLSYAYEFTNTSGVSQKFNLSRTIIHETGKVFFSGKGNTTLKAGESYKRNVNDPVTSRLKPGIYTITVKIMDKSGKVLSTASTKFDKAEE